MEHVTNEMLAQALIVIKRDIDDLKPIPTTGPITQRQAVLLASMDRGVTVEFESDAAVFRKKYPFGVQTWNRELVRETFPFPLISE